LSTGTERLYISYNGAVQVFLIRSFIHDMAGFAVFSSNGVRRINEVKLRRARLVQGLVTTFGGVYHHGIYPDHSGPLSLAIPPWVGAVSTGDGFGYFWEEATPLNS